MTDSSSDIVSKLDRQEVDNIINQTTKKTVNRYDFRGIDVMIRLASDAIEMEANSTDRVLATLGVFQSEPICRGLSLKCLDYKDREPKPSGKIYKLVTPLRKDTARNTTKKILRPIRRGDPKGVRAQIQDDKLRVSSKSRSDLRAIIALLKGSEDDRLDVALQFASYR